MTFLLVAIVLGLLPANIAWRKGRNFFGWWFYGTLLWIIAFPHSLIIHRVQSKLDQREMKYTKSKKCPACAEIIKEEAKVCRYCGAEQTV